MIFFSLYHQNPVASLSPLSIHRLKITKINFHIKIALQLGPKMMQLRKKKFEDEIEIKVKILNNRFTIKCESEQWCVHCEKATSFRFLLDT
jgi:hypothetical protein